MALLHIHLRVSISFKHVILMSMYMRQFFVSACLLLMNHCTNAFQISNFNWTLWFLPRPQYVLGPNYPINPESCHFPVFHGTRSSKWYLPHLSPSWFTSSLSSSSFSYHTHLCIVLSSFVRI